jgi:hypothetical protein
MAVSVRQFTTASTATGPLTITFTDDPIPGNLLFMWQSERNDPHPLLGSSSFNPPSRVWTSVVSDVFVGHGNYHGNMVWRVSDGSERSLSYDGTDQSLVAMWEVEGSNGVIAEVLQVAGASGVTQTIGTFATPAAGSLRIMGLSGENQNWTPASGWTEDWDTFYVEGGDGQPTIYAAHSSSSNVAQATANGSTLYAGVALMIEPGGLDCNPRFIDNFNRQITLTSGTDNYGRTLDGLTWDGSNTIPGGGSTSIYSVDGSSAYLDIDITNDSANSHVESLTVPFELWMLNNQDYTVRFKTSSIPNGTSGHHYTEFDFDIDGPTDGPIQAKARISSSATYGSLHLGGSNVAKTNWIADEWYTLAIQRTNSNTKVKVWADSEVEPVGYAVTLTGDYSWPIDTDAVFTLGIDWTQITSATPARIQFYLDDLIAGCIENVPVTPPTATFGTYTRDRMLLSIRASFTDDNLYNHALVIGTGDKTTTYVSEVRDDDAGSPTRIASIGDRVFKFETDQISSQVAADAAARKAFLQHCLVSEDIDLEAICNPAFEGNDVIAVQELTFSELNRKFRIRAFTIPLSTSRQVFKLSRVIAL